MKCRLCGKELTDEGGEWSCWGMDCGNNEMVDNGGKVIKVWAQIEADAVDDFDDSYAWIPVGLLLVAGEVEV